jgi:hypothetical protein
VSIVLSTSIAGAIRQRTVLEGGRVYNDWQQPDRDRKMAEVARIRRERAARKMAWGQPALEIPELDLAMLKLRNPDLDAPDRATKLAAWRRFMASPESAPYRVQARGGATARSVGGI